MPTEDTCVPPVEDLHSQWIIEEIKKQHSNEIFVPEKWNQRVDWESIKKQVDHIEGLAFYMCGHKMPSFLNHSYLELLYISFQVLRDIFFVNTGFYIDHKANRDMVSTEDFKKLRFWFLRDYEETTHLRQRFEKLFKVFGAEMSLGNDYDEGTWDDIEETLRGVESEDEEYLQILGKEKFRNVKSWCMSYAFAPYEMLGKGNTLDQYSKRLNVSVYISTFFQLFFYLSTIHQIEEKHFAELVQDFAQSEMGERFIQGWRNHMYLSREDFIKKLEEDKTLQRWVKPYCFVADGIHDLLWLFEKNDTSREIDFSLCSNINNWFRILTIAAVLQEYDKKHEKDNLKNINLSIIDEVEASLHPETQKRIHDSYMKSHGGKSSNKPIKTFREFVKDAQRTGEIIEKLHRLIGNKTNTEALKIITEAMWIDLLNRPTATSIKNEFATITCTPTIVSRCLNEPKPTRETDIEKIKMKFEDA